MSDGQAYPPDRSMRRLLKITSVVVALAAGVGGILFAIGYAISESRRGPVHRFPLPAGETFLTDDRAAAIGREVMNRDGFPEAAWKLMTADDGKAPDGRPDRFLSRNTVDANQGTLHFHCENSPTPERFVRIELRDGEITARGTLGK